MTRRFGPNRGAGVRIEEQQGERPIQPGALGLVGYAGLFRKGPVGEAVVTDRTTFLDTFGGLIEEGAAPGAAKDFFDLSDGAGGVIALRITDGNELQAELPLYSRSAGSNVPFGTVKAKNGGRWGGRERVFVGDLAAASALDETILTAGVSLGSTTDQWKGAYVYLDAVPNKRYEVVSNTSAGAITVAGDSKMKTDWLAEDEATNLRYSVHLEDDGQNLAIKIDDGEDNPSAEFSLEVFEDGASVKKWGNLSTDPASARYWVDVINDDEGNLWIAVEDLFVGTHTPAARPANLYVEADTVTASTLAIELAKTTVDAPSGATFAVAIGTTTDAMVEQVLTVEIVDALSNFTVTSNVFGLLGSGELGVQFVTAAPTFNRYVPPFTVTLGSGTDAEDDIITIHYRPLPLNLGNAARLYPNKPDEALSSFRIESNTHRVITVPPGVDLTDISAAGDEVVIAAPFRLAGGRDGNADVVPSDYVTQAWTPDSSPFNALKGQNLGLVKFATPGITDTSVQKAGIAYAAAKNYQYRIEIPANVVSDNGALAYVNNTIGRSDYAVVSFPSYGKIPHPDPDAQREGKLKLVTLTGMIHGREATIARDFDGYHKAGAGITATLPALLKLTTGKRVLDEERLNPAGIQVIVKKRGNFVIWGDRTLSLDPNWRWKHQRELMSYYEHVLQESFDFINFAINDPIEDANAKTSLVSFFFPEWTKRALRGSTFEDAAIIKVDDELNTNAVRDAGDLIASVSLRLADTVERFIIRIGKQGVFSQVS